MRAEELMIGDWVMWKNRKVQIARVGGIVYSFGHIDVTLAYCNDDKILETHDIKSISPILLTPEILEKNGFTNCETTELTRELGNELWYPGEDNYISDPDLMINLGKHSFLVRFAGSIVWNLHYVHELQHFLRLVDYDKEIVL